MSSRGTGTGQLEDKSSRLLRRYSDFSAVQVAPLSKVAATTCCTPEGPLDGPNPTAIHVTGVVQETAYSPVTASGTRLEIQVCPPSLVVRMS